MVTFVVRPARSSVGGPWSAVEVSCDDCCSERVNVVSGLLRPACALRAGQYVLFKSGQFGFIYHHSKVIAL